jgi:thiamine pyrophosphate-dependent acetolactate synthase large subunit-like protein
VLESDGDVGFAVNHERRRNDGRKAFRNITQVAQGLGCHAERVETVKEIVPALKRAIEATESGTPAVLEFITKVEYASSRMGASSP